MRIFCKIPSFLWRSDLFSAISFEDNAVVPPPTPTPLSSPYYFKEDKIGFGIVWHLSNS